MLTLPTETALSILPEYIQNTTVSWSTPISVLPEYLPLLMKVYLFIYSFMPREEKPCNIISLPNWQHKMKNITGLGPKGCVEVRVNPIVYRKEEEKIN